MLWWVLFLTASIFFASLILSVRKIIDRDTEELSKPILVMRVSGILLIVFIAVAVYYSTKDDVEPSSRGCVVVDDASIIRESGKRFTVVGAESGGCHFVFYGESDELLDEVVLPKDKISLTILEDGNELAQRLELKTKSVILLRPRKVLSQQIEFINLYLTKAELNRLLE